MKTFNIVYHNGYTNMHSHQQWMKAPISPHPRQHFFFHYHLSPIPSFTSTPLPLPCIHYTVVHVYELFSFIFWSLHPFSTSPESCHLLVDILMIDSLSGRYEEYLIVVLICISLMISDIEHLFICLLVICMCLWRSIGPFWGVR